MSKGHEPWLYETPEVIAGLFLIFTIVEMKGPNKQSNLKKNKVLKKNKFSFKKIILKSYQKEAFSLHLRFTLSLRFTVLLISGKLFRFSVFYIRSSYFRSSELASYVIL